jgi:hypothetical protein
MGMLRKTAAERRELVSRLIAEHGTTGESWRSISARTGINYATLTGWLWRLRKESASAANSVDAHPAFIEVVTADASEQTNSFELLLRGDRRLRIGARFDESALTRLVRALEAC